MVPKPKQNQDTLEENKFEFPPVDCGTVQYFKNHRGLSEQDIVTLVETTTQKVYSGLVADLFEQNVDQTLSTFCKSF